MLIDQRLSTSIRFGSSSRASYLSQVAINFTGDEKRYALWSQPKLFFTVDYLDTIEQLHEVIELNHACKGILNTFLVKNKLDYKSCAPSETISFSDQAIGTGDDSETEFQLVKNYTKGAETTTVNIYNPVLGTVIISFDDVEQSSGWTVNTTTGIVTFSTPPSAGVVIKAGFEFDIEVRFANDYLPTSLESLNSQAVQIELVQSKRVPS